MHLHRSHLSAFRFNKSELTARRSSEVRDQQNQLAVPARLSFRERPVSDYFA
jgi:hypothetical protein